VVEVTAERFAAFVHVGLREGYALFSDNDFHLLPGETRRIDVLSAEVPLAPGRSGARPGEDQIAARLFARSLIDSRRSATAAEARLSEP